MQIFTKRLLLVGALSLGLIGASVFGHSRTERPPEIPIEYNLKQIWVVEVCRSERETFMTSSRGSAMRVITVSCSLSGVHRLSLSQSIPPIFSVTEKDWGRIIIPCDEGSTFICKERT